MVSSYIWPKLTIAARCILGKAENVALTFFHGGLGICQNCEYDVERLDFAENWFFLYFKALGSYSN